MSLIDRFVPENRNTEHPVGEDISRVVFGTGIAVIGTIGFPLAYKFTEVFTEKQTNGLTIYQDVEPISKIDLIGGQTILTVGAPILLTYGLLLAGRSVKSLTGRIRNYFNQ